MKKLKIKNFMLLSYLLYSTVAYAGLFRGVIVEDTMDSKSQAAHIKLDSENEGLIELIVSPEIKEDLIGLDGVNVIIKGKKVFLKGRKANRAAIIVKSYYLEDEIEDYNRFIERIEEETENFNFEGIDYNEDRFFEDNPLIISSRATFTIGERLLPSR